MSSFEELGHELVGFRQKVNEPVEKNTKLTSSQSETMSGNWECYIQEKALRSIKVSILITDLDGKIEYANPYFSQITGYSPEEYLGKKTGLLGSGYHDHDFYKTLWNKIKSGDTWEGEILSRKKNGDLFWENVVISPISDDENEITHFVSVKTDITEKKKLAEELARNKEKAEESDRLKTAFLHNMSHEIRTPLNAIVGFSRIMTIPGQSAEKQKLYADMISSSSEKLTDIITDVIEISQIQSQQVKLYPVNLNISSLTESIFSCFQRKAAAHNINMQFINNIGPDFTVVSDADKMKKIIGHLLDNAVKFTPSGGIVLSIDKDSKNLVLSVTDTGIGISKDQQGFIFEPFRQVETGTNRNYGGNGLGLSLVKSYTELLNGQVSLISEEGKGTNVTVTIPLKTTETAEEKEKMPVLDKDVAGTTILIAEDETINYIYLRELLQNKQTRILHAVNGQEAIDLCRENESIDLILMDIKMPVMDGNKAAQIIKEFRPHLPIIAQSAYKFESDYSNVFDDYLSKPIRHQVLKDKLLRYVQL